MAQRHHHYERAFEAYLRSIPIPYVAVDEAKKALLPSDAALRVTPTNTSDAEPIALKSFDFVVYGSSNLLIDIKGRRVASKPNKPATRSSLQSWVTQDDVDSLRTWASLFGHAFIPAFVFLFWFDHQPPDALFQEIFESQGRWYALRAITLDAYASAMKPRSARWRTVHLPAADFENLSQPFAPLPQSPATNRSVLAEPDLGPTLPALHTLDRQLASLITPTPNQP